MTELNRYVELRRAYDCGLLLSRNLRHLRYGLWLYQDEIALERLFAAKTLVSFAGHVDRLLVTFAKRTEYAMEELRSLHEFNFSEFTAEVSAAISKHFQDITLALCPYDGEVVPRSKWITDGAPHKDYRALLNASRNLARAAQKDLYHHHSYFVAFILDAAARELDSLGEQLELAVVVQRCDKAAPYSDADSEEDRSDG